MPVMVQNEKWILYKHTCNYELIKAFALVVKNSCASDISEQERYRMQERLTALDLYHTRNPKEKPLDSINHRINTLEYYMFGYEEKTSKKFIFSPLGNLFLKHINDGEEILRKIFITMLFAIQHPHPANGTPHSFQNYPFRLIFKLLCDQRLNYRLYNDEYAYIIPFVKTIDSYNYDKLVAKIIDFRRKDKTDIAELMKKDEHTYVNCVHEWQYFMQTLLSQIGIFNIEKGKEIVKLYHPSKPNSKSKPTFRTLTDGYVEIEDNSLTFIKKMLLLYSPFQTPVLLDDSSRMQIDIIKEIYSFLPQILLEEIGDAVDETQMALLNLPALIERYADNPDNETSTDFEYALRDGFNSFYNVEAKRIGGAGHTDIECLYFTKKKKFAVEAKSTIHKLLGINAGRLNSHREEIGGEYTIVITPRYVPAIKNDIKNQPIVIILAHTFSEYLYNHFIHDVREIDFSDFDNIIINNLGLDISKQISDMTMEKFATIVKKAS